MAKGYNDLSRRGLIQLNEDFDNENEGMLLDYLSKNDDKYEGVRTIEQIVERCDNIKESMTSSGSGIKKALVKGIDFAIDKAVDALGALIERV